MMHMYSFDMSLANLIKYLKCDSTCFTRILNYTQILIKIILVLTSISSEQNTFANLDLVRNWLKTESSLFSKPMCIKSLTYFVNMPFTSTA